MTLYTSTSFSAGNSYNYIFPTINWKYGVGPLQCDGNEMSLEECPEVPKVDTDYGYNRYAYVHCYKGN